MFVPGMPAVWSSSMRTEIAAKILLTEPPLAAVVRVAVVPGPATVPMAWLRRMLSGDTRAIDTMDEGSAGDAGDPTMNAMDHVHS